jgi:glycosyltransferase involved in cell wall biosynthesis
MSGQVTAVLGMILKGYPRISETFISNEIELLEQQGITIRIFSMRAPREAFTHASVQRIRARVDYLPETMRQHLPRLCYHNLRLAIRTPRRFAGALGLALGRFIRTRKTATLKHLLQAGYLVDRLLPGSRVVHLHAHFAHSPTSVAMFVGRLSGLPFSFTAHAKDIYTADPRQLREKITLARFVITCTEYNRRHLIGLARSARTPIKRIYHGIDVRLFSSNGRPGRYSPPYQLLTVARLTPKKGVPTVLAAIKCLLDRGIAVQHTLIGDGEERRSILSLVDALGLSGVTRWLGSMPHEQVLDHYRRADLFVLGCQVALNGDRDGIPNVLVESMAMGLPVVATHVSAIPELIQDGWNGLLVPPRRPDLMADAVQRLLTDSFLYQSFATAGRIKVRAQFDNQRLIRQLGGFYRQQLPLLVPKAPAA